MSERNLKSHWWFLQKILAFVVTAGLALFLFNLIISAIDKVGINELVCEFPQMPSGPAPFMPDLNTDMHVVLPTLSLKEKTTVHLDAIFSRSDLNQLVKERVKWHLLSNKNNVWTIVDNFKSGFDYFEFSIEDGGHYLIIVSLPPVVLNNLSGKATEQLKPLLSNSLGSKCKAFQIIVNGATPTDDGYKPTPLETEETSLKLSEGELKPSTNPEIGQKEPKQKAYYTF